MSQVQSISFTLPGPENSSLGPQKVKNDPKNSPLGLQKVKNYPNFSQIQKLELNEL